jgi:hypothetical protein
MWEICVLVTPPPPDQIHLAFNSGTLLVSRTNGSHDHQERQTAQLNWKKKHCFDKPHHGPRIPRHSTLSPPSLFLEEDYFNEASFTKLSSTMPQYILPLTATPPPPPVKWGGKN